MLAVRQQNVVRGMQMRSGKLAVRPAKLAARTERCPRRRDIVENVPTAAMSTGGRGVGTFANCPHVARGAHVGTFSPVRQMSRRWNVPTPPRCPDVIVLTYTIIPTSRVCPDVIVPTSWPWKGARRSRCLVTTTRAQGSVPKILYRGFFAK